MVALAAIAEAAHAAQSLTAYDQRVIDLFERRVGFDVAMFVRHGAMGEHARGIRPDVRRAVRNRFPAYGREYAALAEHAVTSSGGAVVDREFLGPRALERTAVYRELMRPHAGKSSLIGYLAFRGKVVAALVIGRCSERFSPHEVAELRQVVPLLALNEIALSSSRGRVQSLAALTARERQIVEYLRLGYTNREIALACGSSPHTVRNQLVRVFEKLGASTRAEAVANSYGEPRGQP